MSVLTKLGRIGVDSLNEYADQTFAGCIILSSRPSRPSFHFYSLAHDACVWSWSDAMLAELSNQARQLLTLVNLKGYSHWCPCLDDQLSQGVGMHPASDVPVTCWACIFDAHGRCTQPHGCDPTAEIHFPETILDPRVRAAA